MQYRPVKGKHFSRYGMAAVFLFCGILLLSVNWIAGTPFIALGLVVLYFAPKWNLNIEFKDSKIFFSENVVEINPVELAYDLIAKVRRIEEKESRKGLLFTFPDSYAFIEFETYAGKVYRMNDIFGPEFDEEIQTQLAPLGTDLILFLSHES